MEEGCLQLSPKGKHILYPLNFTRDSVPIAGSLVSNDLVLVVTTLRMFMSDDKCSGLAEVYTVKSSERYFGNAVVNEVWHIKSIL